jgi:hypothetical protein
MTPCLCVLGIVNSVQTAIAEALTTHVRSINTAWLSVASSVAALVVPSAYGARAGTEIVAVSLAALFTVVGELWQLKASSPLIWCSSDVP